jgi:hypothetical protein
LGNRTLEASLFLQNFEAGFMEMRIEGEGFADTEAGHYGEAHAIDGAGAGASPDAEEVPGVVLEFEVGIDDLYFNRYAAFAIESPAPSKTSCAFEAGTDAEAACLLHWSPGFKDAM